MDLRNLKYNNFILFGVVLVIAILAVNYSGYPNRPSRSTASPDSPLYQLQLLQIAREQKALIWRIAETQYAAYEGHTKGYLPITRALQLAKEELNIPNDSFLDSLEDICFTAEPPTWRITLNKNSRPVTVVINAVTGQI